MANGHPAHKKEGASLGETLWHKIMDASDEKPDQLSQEKTYLHYRIEWIEQQPGCISIQTRNIRESFLQY